MASTASAIVNVHPSFTMPEALMIMEQASGYTEVLGGGKPMVRIATEDQYVYINAFDIRTNTHGGQSSANMLPGCAITPFQISTPTYLVQSSSQWNHHEAAAFGQFGHSLLEAERLGNRQAFAQTFRNYGLYGFNPANGEGLVNTAGATVTNLPADSFGNTTVLTYDNGQMSQYLLQQIIATKIRMNQLGMANDIQILGPQRILGLWDVSIVQVTSAQRPGAGFLTTAGVVETVMTENGDTFGWGYDDTLQNQGGANVDYVLIVIPEIKVPAGVGPVNTNLFATLTPGLKATTLQFTDMAAPREITVPLSRGAVDVTYEQKMTSGWGLRGEAITIIQMTY
jgi:hypothetical protein